MSSRAPIFRSLLRTSHYIRHTSRFSSRFSSRCHYSQLPVHDITTRRTSQGSQWIRYTTPYSLASIRCFSRPARLQADSSAAPLDSAKRIDQVMEEIHDLYGSASDEFEIAAEETEKNTTYAPEDRAAAREEVDKLLAYYKSIEEGSDREVAEAVKKRVGSKVKELEQAMLGLEEVAKNGD